MAAPDLHFSSPSLPPALPPALPLRKREKLSLINREMAKHCSGNIVLALIITASLAVNLHQLLSRQPCQPCRPCVKVDDRDSLQSLPLAEQRLHDKVLETNYTNIWMGPAEVNLVLRYIHGKKTYLEWGSGGSTMNFPRWVEKAVSIEHDRGWCAQMNSKLANDDQLQHVDYHCVPINRGTDGWGKTSPFEEGDYTVFRPYVDEIHNCGVDLYDFVLIDGRARVDCAIKALSFIKDDSVVVLHDSSRIWQGKYSDVGTYYDFMNYVDGFRKQGIVVMKRKAKFSALQGSHAAVQDILDKRYPVLETSLAKRNDPPSSNV